MHQQLGFCAVQSLTQVKWLIAVLEQQAPGDSNQQDLAQRYCCAPCSGTASPVYSGLRVGAAGHSDAAIHATRNALDMH